MGSVEASYTDSDIRFFLELFRGREDVWAKQWVGKDGAHGYSPQYSAFDENVLKKHLSGELTVGVYIIRLDNTVNFFVLDIDIKKEVFEKTLQSQDTAREIKRKMREFLRELIRIVSQFFDFAIEFTGGRGVHLWFFLETPCEALEIYEFGKIFINYISDKIPSEFSVEFFPKQSSAEKLGNLVKLPLGVHKKYDNRSFFLSKELEPVSSPFDYLRSVKKVSKEDIYSAKIKILFEISERIDSLTHKEEREEKDELGEPRKRRILVSDPLWTEADFERPKIKKIFEGCEVLNFIKEKVIRTGSISHDEALVLQHSLGYFPEGVLAVNYILSLVKDEIPENFKLKSTLSGNPISCEKIRKRVPHIIPRVRCDCKFPKKFGYPTPILHSRGVKDENFFSSDIYGLMAKFITMHNTSSLLEKQKEKVARKIAEELKGTGKKKMSYDIFDFSLDESGNLVVSLRDGQNIYHFDFQNQKKRQDNVEQESKKEL